ncbi:unnamed protein product, partial [Effrenium voratum]
MTLKVQEVTEMVQMVVMSLKVQEVTEMVQMVVMTLKVLEVTEMVQMGDFWLTIFVVHTRTFMNIMVNKDYTVMIVKAMLSQDMTVPIRHQRLVFNDRDLEDNVLLENLNLTKSDFFELFIRGQGGMPRRTTREETDEVKLERLQKRLRADTREVDVTEVDRVINALTSVKSFITEEEFPLQECLNKMTVEQLRQVLENIPVNKSGSQAANMLENIVKSLVPGMRDMKKAMTTCQDVFTDITCMFLSKYADEHHTLHSNVANLNHKSFKQTVEGLIDLKIDMERKQVRDECEKR